MLFLGAIPSPGFKVLNLGPLSFRAYGVAIAIGALTAIWIARKRWSEYGGDPEEITSLALVAVPAGLIGARLYHVITDWSSLYSDGRWWPDAFMIWNGGLGIPGGLIAGSIAAVLMTRRLGLEWRRVGDAVAPAIPVAQAIGRLGNWFNQEVFGRPTNLPWGLRIDVANRPFGYAKFATFHPTFLYEGLWNLALAAFIMVVSRRVVLRPGRWFAMYVMGYGLGRLWVEGLRIDRASLVLGLRVNIWMALAATVGGLVWLFWRGSPIDMEATERMKGGEQIAHIRPMGSSRLELPTGGPGRPSPQDVEP